jgi:hypothetical protein
MSSAFRCFPNPAPKDCWKRQGGNPSDVTAARSILSAGVVSASPPRLTGTWRCRTIKLGGLTPTIVYSWFKCRISDRGGQLLFEKIGGSQRTSGTLYPDGGGFVYLGASYVHYNGANEKPPHYSGTGAQSARAKPPTIKSDCCRSPMTAAPAWSCPPRCRNRPSM